LVAETTFSVKVEEETGIIDIESSLFEIYPNPVSQLLYIDAEKITGKDIVVKIIDQSGRLILTKQLVKDKPIDVGNLPGCVAVVQ